MKLTRLVLPLALLAIAGCSSTKPAEPASTARVAAPTATTTAMPDPRPTPTAPSPTAQSTVRTVTHYPLDDPKTVLDKRTVYVDFDSFVVHGDDRQVIDSHAKHLASTLNHLAR